MRQLFIKFDFLTSVKVLVFLGKTSIKLHLVADPRGVGVRDVPLSVQILSFSCGFFCKNIAK